jgi:hypothetical protein
MGGQPVEIPVLAGSLIDEGVILIGGDGLFAPALAPEGDPRPPAGGRPQLILRQVQQAPGDGVDHQAHHLARPGGIETGPDDGGHRHGDLPGDHDQLFTDRGGGDLAQDAEGVKRLGGQDVVMGDHPEEPLAIGNEQVVMVGAEHLDDDILDQPVGADGLRGRTHHLGNRCLAGGPDGYLPPEVLVGGDAITIGAADQDRRGAGPGHDPGGLDHRRLRWAHGDRASQIGGGLQPRRHSHYSPRIR